jgi:hypothetical protein
MKEAIDMIKVIDFSEDLIITIDMSDASDMNEASIELRFGHNVARLWISDTD